MRRFLLTLILCGAPMAYAYEYQLPFNACQWRARTYGCGLSVQHRHVVGDCSYYTATSGSGRGSRSTTTYHYNVCMWDLYGNLISLTPVSSPLAAPTPLQQTGTEIVYAVNGASSTGRDTRGFGFVNTPSSHYSWQTPSGGYAVIP